MLLIGVSLIGITLIAQCVDKIVPAITETISPLSALMAINSLPIAGVAIGIVNLLLVLAVWRGRRWGIYGLLGTALVQLVLATWGTGSPGEFFGGAMSTASNNIPLIVLLLMIRPKWQAMR